MVKVDDKRHQELLNLKKELEENRPHDITAMRDWKHSMSKILQELELFK
jgi:cephalosporin hydroxylase